MDEKEHRTGKYERKLVEKPPSSIIGMAHPYVKVAVVVCFLIIFYTSTPLAWSVCVALFVVLCLTTSVNPLRDPIVLALIVCGAIGGGIIPLMNDSKEPPPFRAVTWAMVLWAGRLGVLAASAKVLFKWVSKNQALYIAQSIFGPIGGAALVPMFYHSPNRLSVHVSSIRVALRSRGLRSIREHLWYGLSCLLATVFGETHQLQKMLVQNGILAGRYRPYRAVPWRIVDLSLCILMVVSVSLIVLLELRGN